MCTSVSTELELFLNLRSHHSHCQGNKRPQLPGFGEIVVSFMNALHECGGSSHMGVVRGVRSFLKKVSGTMCLTMHWSRRCGDNNKKSGITAGSSWRFKVVVARKCGCRPPFSANASAN